MSSTSSKRLCLEIGPDELSHITSFLFTDAFESACDIVNMSRTCRSWKDLVTWRDWSKTFSFFPLDKDIPRVLVPIMLCAKTNGMHEIERRIAQYGSSSTGRDPKFRAFRTVWTINRAAAKKHLGLNQQSWNILRSTRRDYSRGRGDKHMYALGDILRETARRFGSISACEKHLLRSARAAATREKTALRIKERKERQQQVTEFLLSNGVYGYRGAHTEAYIYKGIGKFEEVCTTTLREIRESD